MIERGAGQGKRFARIARMDHQEDDVAERCVEIGPGRAAIVAAKDPGGVAGPDDRRIRRSDGDGVHAAAGRAGRAPAAERGHCHQKEKARRDGSLWLSFEIELPDTMRLKTDVQDAAGGIESHGADHP